MKSVFVGLFIAMVALTFTASAESVDILLNECSYMPEINKDFCQTFYKICENKLSPENLRMIYADMKEKVPEFKDYLSKIDVDVKYIEDEISISPYDTCYKAEIRGYKSPLDIIDNVLCLDGKRCYYEYALWNESFYYRNAVYGNISSLGAGGGSTVYGLVPLNMTFNASTELLWCNFTIGSVNTTIGWIYWNNYTDYICVDTDESSAVITIIDEGNGTQYSLPGSDLLFWANLRENISGMTYDLSLYNLSFSNTAGDPDFISSKIGKGMSTSSGTDNDGMSWGYEPSVETPQNLTIAAWVKPDSTGQTGIILGYDDRSTGENSIILYVDPTDKYSFALNLENLETPASGGDVVVGEWDFIVGTYNGTTKNIYENSVLVGTEANETGNIEYHGSEYLTVGCRWWSGSGYSLFIDGTIDNVMMWNRTLTENEIKLLYYSQLMFFTNGSTEQNITFEEENITVINYSYTTYFCSDSDYLYKVEKSIADNGTAIFNPYLEYCTYGCNNYTMMNLGLPGCRASPILQFLIFIAIISIIITGAKVGLR